MDAVIVMVYNASQTTRIPTAVRARWIQQCFPKVKVILADDGPQATGYTQAIIDLQNTYIQHTLDRYFAKQKQQYGTATKPNITFYSSEPYGEHVSRGLGFHNRIVDERRLQKPVSSTQLRRNPIDVKTFCTAAVCVHLKPRFYFVGGTSTGKTTISQYAAKHLNASYCREYGREYWFAHQQNHRLSMEDLETIASIQQQIEQQACETAHDLVCIDTNAITTCAFALYYFGELSDTLLQLLERDVYRYQSPHYEQPQWHNQHIFLCDDDIPFDDTWDRSGIGSREELQRLNKQLLARYNIPYTVLSGSVQARFKQIQNHIQEHVSWSFSTPR